MSYDDLDLMVEETDVYVVETKTNEASTSTTSKAWQENMKNFDCLIKDPKREIGIFYN